jgi:hypothetical protein
MVSSSSSSNIANRVSEQCRVGSSLVQLLHYVQRLKQLRLLQKIKQQQYGEWSVRAMPGWQLLGAAAA